MSTILLVIFQLIHIAVSVVIEFDGKTVVPRDTEHPYDAMIRTGDPVELHFSNCVMLHNGAQISTDNGWTLTTNQGKQIATAKFSRNSIGHYRCCEDSVDEAHLVNCSTRLDEKPEDNGSCPIAQSECVRANTKRCHLDSDKYICDCKNGWQGRLCESPVTESQLTAGSTPAKCLMIAVIGSILTCLIVLFGMRVWRIHNAPSEAENTEGAQPLMVVTVPKSASGSQ